MTRRLVRHIEEQSAHRVYVAGVGDCGVGERTVRNIARKLTKQT